MPKATQLDFLDHLQDKVKDCNEINTPELRDISNAIDQLYLVRPRGRRFDKEVRVRSHVRYI